MSHDEQLAWEARAGKPAAIAAFAAAVVLFASNIYLSAVLGGISREADEYLRDAADEPAHFIVSGVLVALGSLLILPALAYLYRATRYRRPEMAPTGLILLVLGVITYAVVTVWQPIEVTKLAKDFFPFEPAGDLGAITDPDEYLEAVSPEEAAEKESREALPSVVRGMAAGGTLALAFGVVMISLNAMRAGLLSRFMGVLGIIIGVLYVIPIGVQVLPLFWFGAMGLLFLGRWPGAGRGPAWETGEAIPWPSAADRLAPQEEPQPEGSPEQKPAGSEPDGAGPDGAGPARSEPAATRPASRKRKKKRR